MKRLLVLTGAAGLILLIGSLLRRPLPSGWNALVTVGASAATPMTAARTPKTTF